MQFGVSIVKDTIVNMQKNAATTLNKRLTKIADDIGEIDKKLTLIIDYEEPYQLGLRPQLSMQKVRNVPALLSYLAAQ
jgi:flagellar biosynthesis chaperone FliJ